MSEPTVSQKRIEANRRNALKSTGPRTPEGKQRSARNATTHALFCVDIVVEGESHLDYHRYRQALIRRLDPRDALEMEFVEQIIHSGWKVRRAQASELEIFADRRAELIETRPGESVEPGYVLGDLVWQSPEFIRLQNYTQRHLNAINRATNQLRRLKNDRVNGVLSEFAGELVQEEQRIIQNIENEPTDDPNAVSDGASEACDEPRPDPRHRDRSEREENPSIDGDPRPKEPPDAS